MNTSKVTEGIIIDHLNEIAKQVYPLFMQPAEAAEGIVKKREALVTKLASNIMNHHTIMTSLSKSKEVRDEQLDHHDEVIKRYCDDFLPKEHVKIIKSSVTLSETEMYITTTIVSHEAKTISGKSNTRNFPRPPHRS